MNTKRRLLFVAALSLALAASLTPAIAGGVHHVPSYGGSGGHGGHDHGGHGGGGYYGGYYPYFGYYGPYAYGYGYGYGYYGPPFEYGYPYPAEEPDFGIIDCDVEPEEAKVYLDGQKLGEADDFDGFPEYLTVPTGYHVIEFRRHGYQVLRLEMEVKAGRYYEVDRKMHAGDINGKPWIEYWGAPPRGQEPEEDRDAPPPPRTHHYNEKPRDPKAVDSQGDQGDPSGDTNTPDANKADAKSPNPRP